MPGTVACTLGNKMLKHSLRGRTKYPHAGPNIQLHKIPSRPHQRPGCNIQQQTDCCIAFVIRSKDAEDQHLYLTDSAATALLQRCSADTTPGSAPVLSLRQAQAQCCCRCCKIIRWRRCECYRLTSARVLQRKRPGVQRLAADPWTLSIYAYTQQ